jgi:hypothetical protein
MEIYARLGHWSQANAAIRAFHDLGLADPWISFKLRELKRVCTRTRTNTNPNDTKANAASRRGVRVRSANNMRKNQGA